MSRRSRLYARPSEVDRPGPSGSHRLAGSALHDGYVYVPHSYRRTRPAPLMVMLHGSGGHAHHGLAILQSLAEQAGLLLLAPASADYTWDVVSSRYAPDVITVNKALEQVFAAYAVDPEHVALAGFSDGASYALSLGLANGDLFTHVIAFSPTFVAIAAELGRPRVFVSHGARDEVLPLSSCGRILRQLERMGLEVEYTEFDAGHRIPSHIARQAVEWFTGAAESEPEPRPRRLRGSQPSPEG